MAVSIISGTTSGRRDDGLPASKNRFYSGWLQDEITLRDLPITLLGEPAMTVIAVAATATKMLMPTMVISRGDDYQPD